MICKQFFEKIYPKKCFFIKPFCSVLIISVLETPLFALNLGLNSLILGMNGINCVQNVNISDKMALIGLIMPQIAIVIGLLWRQ